MRIETDPKYDFDDVLIRPKRSTLSSRKDVNLKREFTFLHSAQSYNAIPIIAANMDHTGTFEMANALANFGVSTALHKHYALDTYVDNYTSIMYRDKTKVPVFYSMGISNAEFEQLEQISKLVTPPKYINIDIANGYSEQFANFVKQVRSFVGEQSVIMAGNVVTGEMTQQLLLSGADIVKVGIGPGSVCTTRKITGVGYPQLSAIIECADAAHGLGGLICGDGGCKVPGDVAKAFAAGADFVMLGGMLAGHDECTGEVISDADSPFIKKMRFYGMSSDTAMVKYSGGVADYKASEGKTVEVDYKGPVSHTIKEILGGVRSACTYVGARRLKQLSKCTTFVLVNRQLNNKFTD